MRILILILLTYVTLSAEGSLLSGTSTVSPGGSPWRASLSPVLILLAFSWVGPLAAGILSAFIAIWIEMRYSASPGTALILTTFFALLLTQSSIQRYVRMPIIFLLSCFPVVLIYDYTLLVIIELLSPLPAAEAASVPALALPPILGSVMVALRSCAIVAVISIIFLGCRAMLAGPREAETV
ncbi:hypothetical protein [Lacunimicrobium album]